MKKIRIYKVATFIVLGFLASCIEEAEDISGVGKNRFRLNASGGNYSAVYDAPSGENLELIQVWRDVTSESELAKSATVEFELDTAIISEYNAANGTEILPMPEGSYQLVSTSVSFSAGEFNKPIVINLNAGDLDLSKSYALGLRLKNPSGGTELSSNSESVIQIVIKNKYDGVYSATGNMVDTFNPALTGYYPLTWELVTSGANQVIVFDNEYLGFPGHIISAGGGLSYYGTFGLVVTFDLETDKITSVENYYGCPAGGLQRCAILDPSGNNRRNPDGSIEIKYILVQGGVERTYFDEVWEYKGAR